MDRNPWIDLPSEPDYVLAIDRDIVTKFNSRRKKKPNHPHLLRIDKLLPEPFVGAKYAPVLLLSNNPGFSAEEEKLRSRQDDDFRSLMRKNLHHELFDWPFLYLHPNFKGSGRQWWSSKLKPLIKKFGEQIVAQTILNVVFFPYPSRLFGHLRCPVPSQDYGFELVRQAVERNAVVIHMRKPVRGSRDIWADKVPRLSKYERRFRVQNYMTPRINPKLRDFQDRQRGFQEVIEAIEAFAKTQIQRA